jgi:hypothetical protein
VKEGPALAGPFSFCLGEFSGTAESYSGQGSIRRGVMSPLWHKAAFTETTKSARSLSERSGHCLRADRKRIYEYTP